jgi:hypothetical protein
MERAIPLLDHSLHSPTARGVPVGVVAHVTNAIDHRDEPFDKGMRNVDRLLLDTIGTAGGKLAGQTANGGQQV